MRRSTWEAGCWIDRTGGDELDIERRITAASKAFGASLGIG
jgi:hypothetical protein